MRLIDADKLWLKTGEVDAAPTVESIPCEWIINKANELHQYAFGTPEDDDDYYNRCIAHSDAKALNRVLHLWREENGINR